MCMWNHNASSTLCVYVKVFTSSSNAGSINQWQINYGVIKHHSTPNIGTIRDKDTLFLTVMSRTESANFFRKRISKYLIFWTLQLMWSLLHLFNYAVVA